MRGSVRAGPAASAGTATAATAGSTGPMTRRNANRFGTKPDRLLALGLFLLAFVLAATGVRRNGLSWDEPTYFHFAQVQRQWCGDMLAAVIHPGRLGALLSESTIHEVWLQDPQSNGHPPLNETWMGLAGVPARLFGAPDVVAFRIAITLLLAGTCALLFLLLRRGLSRTASAAGALAFIGIPAVWAHGHNGATETIQNLFWVLFALLLPLALDRGGKWLWIWLLVSALSFMAKFTNVLVPAWVLGTAGLLGAWRRKRLWTCAALAFVAGPALLMLLDPFFWPWLGGIPRFFDYLRQTTTRAQWVGINVFYLGKSWGFYPPWHYRLVMTAATCPVPVLLLALPGLFYAGRAVWRALRGQVERTGIGPEWPRVLGLSGILLGVVVGVLPNSPNHDGTRQFVYMYVAVALLAGAGAEGILAEARRRWSGLRPGLVKGAAAVVLALAAAAFVISISHEPWGLSYYSEWLGGERGAWNRGFDLTWWTETISPRLAAEAALLPPRDGKLVHVHPIPKLNYFADAEPFIRPLLPAEARDRPYLARDVFSAYYAGWARPLRATTRGALLGLTFQAPVDAILISYRRATVAPGLWEFLQTVAEHGEIDLVDEVRVGGVPLARLYRVKALEEVRIPEDPEKRPWWQIPSVAAAARAER